MEICQNSIINNKKIVSKIMAKQIETDKPEHIVQTLISCCRMVHLDLHCLPHIKQVLDKSAGGKMVLYKICKYPASIVNLIWSPLYLLSKGWKPIYRFTVFNLITTHTSVSTQSSNFILFRLQPLYMYFCLLLYKGICSGYPFELHWLFDAIQMSTRNICFYKENQKKKTTNKNIA